MCGIVGFVDRTGRLSPSCGHITLTMLEALACRGPDGAGVAIIGPEPDADSDDAWLIRFAGPDERPFNRLAPLGRLVPLPAGSRRERTDSSVRARFVPNPGVSAADVECALGAHRGGLEILSLGFRLDLVKQVGSPSQLEAAYSISTWTGPVAIGHTRLSTESRIDLSHSQPFWVHAVSDLATVHNGHVTNYHQLRRRYEQHGVIFYTDNDSEVIGVYLRDRMIHGRTLPEALADSVADLDGAFNYLVVSTDGLGIVRDRYGFKPLVLAETEQWVAVATEEIALRRAFPSDYSAVEPPPGSVLFLPDEDCMSTDASLSSHEHAVTIDCGDLPVRAINQSIRSAIAAGSSAIRLLHSAGRHNVGVALPEGVELTIEGSVGYYVAGLNDGGTVLVHGGAGWGAGESMRDGTVVINGNAGNAVAASIRAGTVVVRGDASTRAGIAMKGGMLIVAGSAGPMAGFMMQKGVLIVCGDAAAGLADSMYAGIVFLGGKNDELGADAVFEEVTTLDRDLIDRSLERWKVAAPPGGFRKVVAGRRLWNFQRTERELWKSAL